VIGRSEPNGGPAAGEEIGIVALPVSRRLTALRAAEPREMSELERLV
jgi:hypothetical protein